MLSRWCRMSSLTASAVFHVDSETALERLQSVATVLRDYHQYEGLGLEIDEGFCRLLPSRPRRWVHATGSKWAHLGHLIDYIDEKNRVWWAKEPDVLVEEFLW